MVTELDVSQVTGEIKMWKRVQKLVCTDRQLHVRIMVRTKFKQIIKDFDLSFGNDENSAKMVP